MLEILIYERGGFFKGTVGNVIFINKGMAELLEAIRMYAKNIGDYGAVAFYKEKQEFPFQVSAFPVEYRVSYNNFEEEK